MSAATTRLQAILSEILTQKGPMPHVSPPPPLLLRSPRAHEPAQTSLSSESDTSGVRALTPWPGAMSIQADLKLPSPSYFDDAFDDETKARLNGRRAAGAPAQRQRSPSIPSDGTRLPPELISCVFSQLDGVQDILSAASTSRFFRFRTLIDHTEVVDSMTAHLFAERVRLDSFYFFNAATVARRDAGFTNFERFLLSQCRRLDLAKYAPFFQQLFGTLAAQPFAAAQASYGRFVGHTAVTGRFELLDGLQRQVAGWLGSLLGLCDRLTDLDVSGWPLGKRLPGVIRESEHLRSLVLRNIWFVGDGSLARLSGVTFERRICLMDAWRPVLPNLEILDLRGTSIDDHHSSQLDLARTHLTSLQVSPLSLGACGYARLFSTAPFLNHMVWTHQETLFPPQFLWWPIPNSLDSLQLTRATILGVVWGHLFGPDQTYKHLSFFESQFFPSFGFSTPPMRSDVTESLTLAHCDLSDEFLAGFPWSYISTKRLDLSGTFLADRLSRIRFNSRLEVFIANQSEIRSQQDVNALINTRLKELHLAVKEHVGDSEGISLEALDLQRLEVLDLSGQRVGAELLCVLGSQAPCLRRLSLRKTSLRAHDLAAFQALPTRLLRLDLSEHSFSSSDFYTLGLGLAGRQLESLSLAHPQVAHPTITRADDAVDALTTGMACYGELDVRGFGMPASTEAKIRIKERNQTTVLG